ncbi:MAG: ComEC family competence protein [Candidatus Peribacteraceae bacterium]|nr:ComEC family competence protein [Candidatus Peribacteraceae bacterium]
MPLHLFSYSILGTFIIFTFFLRWISPTPLLWSVLPIVGLMVIIFFKKRKAIGFLIFSGCIGATLSMWNVQRSTYIPSPLFIDWYATEQKVGIEGRIISEPDKRPMQTKYTIEVNKIKTTSGKIIENINGRVLVSDHSGYPEYKYGDEIQITGILEKPGIIEKFNYANYLSREEIYSVIYYANSKIIKTGKPSIKRWLYSVKNRFELQINKIYSEPHASFMAGLLTGSRKGIPDHLMESFNTTGLTHIIAISGYNITIVITIIGSLLFWIPLKLRFFPEVLAIIAFTVFVGASAAVVRAAIMGILGLLALQTGRQSNARLTLLWTIFFMILYNPKMLWYDAGFQLSFLAVIGLVELGPILKKWTEKVPDILSMREAFTMTIAAQLSAVPIIVLLFGRLSLIAPIANLLIAPCIPLAMMLGFLGVVVSFFWFFGGQLIAYLGWGFLQWIILVASYFSQIPLASLEIPYISPMLIVMYYIFLFIWILRSRPSVHT